MTGRVLDTPPRPHGDAAEQRGVIDASDRKQEWAIMWNCGQKSILWSIQAVLIQTWNLIKAVDCFRVWVSACFYWETIVFMKKVKSVDEVSHFKLSLLSLLVLFTTVTTWKYRRIISVRYKSQRKKNVSKRCKWLVSLVGVLLVGWNRKLRNPYARVCLRPWTNQVSDDVTTQRDALQNSARRRSASSAGALVVLSLILYTFLVIFFPAGVHGGPEGEPQLRAVPQAEPRRERVGVPRQADWQRGHSHWSL